MSSSNALPIQSRDFATTRWSLVINAAQDDPRLREQSLAVLCESYWYPMYAFVRRQGYNQSDAQDLTQGFFARLLERQEFADLNQSKGRFRSFLLASMKHYLINEWDKKLAAKRGGTQSILSLDFGQAESRFALEPAYSQSPDAIFDRTWALALLEQVRSRLAREFDESDRRDEYEMLQVYLTGEQSTASYRDVGERLGMSEGAVKVAVHRLRKKFGQLLREEISQTVATEHDIDEEIRDLFRALQAH